MNNVFFILRISRMVCISMINAMLSVVDGFILMGVFVWCVSRICAKKHKQVITFVNFESDLDAFSDEDIDAIADEGDDDEDVDAIADEGDDEDVFADEGDDDIKTFADIVKIFDKASKLSQKKEL